MDWFPLVTEIFGMKLMHKDFGEMLFKFAIDFAVVLVVIRAIYYPIHKRKDYLFTYFLFNILIFFLCILLNSVKLSIGFAFGLFAIFGVLRYRTEQLPIKEMTYLFLVIAIGVINSLASKKISIAELAFTNFAIILITLVLERLWLTRHEDFKTVIYEKIDLIKPEKHEELLQDLHERTGLNIERIEIGRIDLLRDTAQIKVYYFEDQQAGGHA